MVLFWAQKLNAFFRKKIFWSEKVFFWKKFLKNLQFVSDRKKSVGKKKCVVSKFSRKRLHKPPFFMHWFFEREDFIYMIEISSNKTWKLGYYGWNCIETFRNTLGFFQPQKIEYFFSNFLKRSCFKFWFCSEVKNYIFFQKKKFFDRKKFFLEKNSLKICNWSRIEKNP